MSRSLGIMASQAFSPNKLADLIVWLDATDASSILDDGTFVSQWNDKSREGNDVDQLIAANQPTTGIEMINGVNALGFDGANGYLDRTTFVNGSLTQPNTMIVVWEGLDVSAPGGNKKLIDGGSGRHVIEIPSTARWQMWAGEPLLGTSVIDGFPYISTAIFDMLSSIGFLNGVQDISGDTGNNTFNGLTIGARTAGSGFFYGKIGEVIVYDRAISEAERQAVEAYLFKKWKI